MRTGGKNRYIFLKGSDVKSGVALCTEAQEEDTHNLANFMR
jgi:hypothetical protein